MAKANGNETAGSKMEVAQKKMTPSQIEKAQQLAKEIWPGLGIDFIYK